MTTDFENYYKVLQVDIEAENDVIEAAYRRLALKYHPDINKSPEAEDKMKLINQARSVLVNPHERQMYDKQYFHNTKEQQEKKRKKTKQKETVDEDIWDDDAIRNLAVQILLIVQQLLNQKKWRLAREKLYAFQDLGISSKDNRILPTFTMTFPEWQNAKELDDLANQQAKQFRTKLTIWSSAVYSLIMFFVGMIYLGFSVGGNENSVFIGFLAGIGGGFAGLVIGVIVALLGTWIYSKWFAGKWGETTDMVLGILTPLIIATVTTTGIYCILGYLIIGGLFYGFSNSNKK